MRASFGRQLIGEVPRREDARDATLLRKDRPTRRLGRVSREHEIDAKLAEAGEDRFFAHTLGAESLEGVFEGAERRATGLAEESLATLARAVVLLGDRREREEVSESPRERQHLRGLESGEPRPKLVRFRRVAATSLFRERTYVFDEPEELIAFFVAEGLPEEVAEGAHVVAQRLRRGSRVRGSHAGTLAESSLDAKDHRPREDRSSRRTRGARTGCEGLRMRVDWTST